jgi:hypothetical protein
MIMVTCSGCPAVWAARATAHCTACHRTFARPGLFDAHRSAAGPHGTCLDPAALVDAAGAPRMTLRAGVWRGRPMPADALSHRRRSTVAAATGPVAP